MCNCEFFAPGHADAPDPRTTPNPRRPGPTLLGEAQLRWLMEGMAASDADFLFVVSSVPFSIPHNDAGGMNFARADKDDSWTVVPARARPG